MTLQTIISNTTHHAHNGLPGYMRASLRTAATGGADGYEQAGYTLGRSLDSESPWSAEADEWDQVLSAVDQFIDDDGQLMAWLAATFPRIWSRVPSKRRGRFVAGVRRGRGEE
jgi:hypothetical protein